MFHRHYYYYLIGITVWKMSKLVLIGSGKIGGEVLNQLALSHYSGPIVVADSRNLVSSPNFSQELLDSMLKTKKKDGSFLSLKYQPNGIEVKGIDDLFQYVSGGDIVINCMPTTFPDPTVNEAPVNKPRSVEYDAMALRKGAHVVAAHKSAFGSNSLYELVEKASKEGNAKYVPAGALMGPTRAMEVIQWLIAHNVEITKAEGIANGTTGFVINKMLENGWGYEKALAEAQKLGYAEPDPSADIKGLDALCKMQALAIYAGNFKAAKLFTVNDERANIPKDLKARLQTQNWGYGIIGINEKFVAHLRKANVYLGLVGAYDRKSGTVYAGPKVIGQGDLLSGVKGVENRLVLGLDGEFDLPRMIDDVFGRTAEDISASKGETNVKVKYDIRLSEEPQSNPLNRGRFFIKFNYDSQNHRLSITGPGAGKPETAIALINAALNLKDAYGEAGRAAAR